MAIKTFKISAEAQGSKAVVRISGYISNWTNSAESFRQQIQDIISKGIVDVDVYINSGGGSCFEANEIGNELKAFKGTKTAILGALCASAATYIACMCDTVKAASNVSYMIHKPMGYVEGNSDEIKALLKALENIEAHYAQVYSDKTGMSVDEVKTLWKNDYWMNADEAKKLGFIDEIDGEEAEVTEDDIETLEASGYKNIPAIAATINATKSNNKIEKEMKDKLLLVLASVPNIGLSASSSDGELITAIEMLKNKALKHDELKARVDEVEKSAMAEKVKNILDKCENEKRITASEREYYKQNLERDFESTSKHLLAKPVVKQLSAGIKTETSAASSEDRSTWTYQDYLDKDWKALAKMETEDPEKHEELFKAHYKKD